VTPPPVALAGGAIDGGFLLVLAIVLPVSGVILSIAFGRQAGGIALALMPAGLGIAVAIAACVWRAGGAVQYLVGGWAPPLGLALRADGLSAAMLLTTAVVMSAAVLFARADFPGAEGSEPERRAPFAFWTLLLAVWGALNAVFLGGDLFNLYVALELLTFGAVPLVSLEGRAETLTAALRYLLFTLVGSVLYLLGAVLLYGAYGTLDIVLLSRSARMDPATGLAAAVMTVGLLTKTALFPLHLWLPPAHAGAPAAASAVLSGLVVKAAFFLIIRLWFDALPGLMNQAAAQLLAALGAAAIAFGSVLAFRQPRLKMLIAYSTVAQIGYLFLMFPLATGAGAGGAWTGGILQAISHACAKAAMFMAAGLITLAMGHDHIARLAGVGRILPVTVFAFGIAGLSLMGLPPSAGFVAKWLLVTSAIDSGQWWWAIAIVAGGLFTGGYLFRALVPALASPVDRGTGVPVPRRREAIVLTLALLSVALGLLPLASFGFLEIGRPDLPVSPH
jgi:formate hydrogenlyase subunit 3/multisubunit Na+/H+ antiporter MnhD subunit